MARTSGSGARAPTQRQLRVGELVRKELSDILTRGELADPELGGVIVTIPEVRMSSDLKLATCFVMPLGGGEGEKITKALNRTAKFVRGMISRRLTMKYMPELRFVHDTRFDDASRIDQLLDASEVARDLETEDDQKTDD
ncbi:30S ribosome-binding factor RbfA [Roseibium limicola]|uniref:Ribosome-binding factor A n=1 Tax=Roseibium limicola TaxID=2816037 RepID=A0A939EP94_9HYPH|nr:30S ribosome-binding factor RbfA [Roseibium limicola]MBO0346420.1 30S ribosome-binding factor RbfA [Roseibium limicola]